MQVKSLNTEMVEDFLTRDDRCVLPIGSTEQHGPLSLAVNAILAEKVATDAAEPLGIPVYPALAYGLCPYFTAYPGTVSLRVETLLLLVRDIVASFYESGFRRVIIVNGHGGNAPVGALVQDLMRERPDMAIKFHNWWNAPRTWEKVEAIDPVASHASWMENFPWTRLPNMPPDTRSKPMLDMASLRVRSPKAVRELVGDGVYGGDYEKPDEVMLALWEVAVAETRAVMEGPWS